MIRKYVLTCNTQESKPNQDVHKTTRCINTQPKKKKTRNKVLKSQIIKYDLRFTPKRF